MKFLCVIPLLVISSPSFAESIIPDLEMKLGENTSFKVYGQLSFSWLSYDDGVDSYNVDFMDMDQSPSRIGFTLDHKFSWADFTANAEFGYPVRDSASLNLWNNDDLDYDYKKEYIRNIEVMFETKRYGKISLGQGSVATDGIAESDLSNVGLVSYSSILDSAGAQPFRRNDRTISDLYVYDVYDNFDGSRRVRVRYDTPEFQGLSVAVSYGQDALNEVYDDEYDIAAFYNNDFGNFSGSASTGYHKTDGGNEFYSMSGSLKHNPTGVSFTAAAGKNNTDGGTDPHYVYAKLAYDTDVWRIGSTGFGIDYYHGKDFLSEDATSESWSVAAVQTIEVINSDIFLHYRDYSYDDDSAEYENGHAIYYGFRFKF